LILRPDATMSGKIREKTIANDAGSSARAATDGKSISAFSAARHNTQWFVPSRSRSILSPASVLGYVSGELGLRMRDGRL
jgi:hypothetical protein